MTGERVVRRLAAILAADVAGYSRLMGRDENGTLARLKAHRTERLEPVLARRGGRLVKLTGDGALMEFSSAVDALSAAIEFQQAMAEANRDQPEDTWIIFRTGLHLGDLIVDGDDLYGDGVNVAARLETESSPGGILISGDIHNAVAGRLKANFADRGSLALKNIERRVQAFDVTWEPADWPMSAVSAPQHSAIASSSDTTLALPDKPSIAVLPFQNMSNDPEQEYLTDGITEDIITELSRFHELFVIARNSSFTYKGRPVDVRTMASELGVRYVLEGSIRKAADRIRVTGQLVDAVTGNHIWADRYDRVLEDIFAVQEELAQSIVRTIAPHISEAEAAKVRRRRPESLSAYEIAVRASTRGWEAYVKSDGVLREEAIADARAALAIDARSSLALNTLAFAQWQHILFGTAADRKAAWQDGMQAATRSIDGDRTGNLGHTIRGLLLANGADRSRIDEALASVQLGHVLNPNSTGALMALAVVEIMTGNLRAAIGHLQEALRISPRDPLRYVMHMNLAMASLCASEYANGVSFAQLAIREVPAFPGSHMYLALNHVGLGEIEKANAEFEIERQFAPGFIEPRLAGGFAFRTPEHLRRATIFLRVAAGLENPDAADAVR